MTNVLPEEKSMPVLASDEYRVWIVAVSCSMIAFFLFGVFRSYGILYLEIIITFHTTRAQASWPLSLCASIMNVVGIFAGLLIHFVSAHCIVLAGMVVLALSFSLCFLAQNTVHLIVFLGVLQGLTRVLVIVVVPEYLGLENQAIAQGLLMFVVGITSMGKPLLIGYFRDETGSYDNVFLILGALSIIVAILWLLEPLLKRQRVVTSQQKIT
ncbi:monocarboxylate transporter 13-like isoform X3 [Tachypleus tridentatus]|uniref:monocarboxylate transporter 13-like isoform X3 n=1 Tax=Tachypleus tridentatus TaxID=6853 RepID=UPI003FD336F3